MPSGLSSSRSLISLCLSVTKLKLQVRGMYRGSSTSERNVQETSHMRGLYRRRTLHTYERNVDQDGDNPDGHYKTLFAEQLTRTVLI